MLPVFFGALLAFLFLIHVFSLPIKKKKKALCNFISFLLDDSSKVLKS